MNKKKWFTALKILAAYLVAAWTLLQFVDWVLSRYNISPYWVDVLLWFFVGIIPSLTIYLYHKERIDQRIFKLRDHELFGETYPATLNLDCRCSFAEYDADTKIVIVKGEGTIVLNHSTH